MKKLAVAISLMVSISATSQTLFYYGNDSVSTGEFLRAYNKNNTNLNSRKALHDYLNLFIASRLKIKEAKENGYDTLPQMVSEIENLKQQVMPTYINDKESVDKLVNEAFIRSQKDIHLAHIFISFTSTAAFDTINAIRKLSEVMRKLKSNLPFEEVARTYSDDPSVKENGGDIGYITVFTLPYELENLAYSTPVHQLSAVYRSRAGFHIFKNLGEQKDPGKWKVAQVLLAFPPNSNKEEDSKIKKTADSIYNCLLKGEDIAKFATLYSNDVISASANGQLPEFGIGEYSRLFEKQVYDLKQPGAVSKPFTTPYGYHILKLISKRPVNSNNQNNASMDALRNKVIQSDRMKSIQSVLVAKILKEVGYHRFAFNSEDLWIYTDSVINYTKPNHPTNITNETLLIKLGDRNENVNEWISYAQTFRYKSDGSGLKSYSVLWDDFVSSIALDYYQRHLDKFNKNYSQQINEFKEGNLFFEIMQRKIWGPAQSDSNSLLGYYEHNKAKYNWTKSADAIIFYASDSISLRLFTNQLKKDQDNWRVITSEFGEKITADSSRFELTHLPNRNNIIIKKGTLTSPVLNKADNTYSFALIKKVYDKPEPKSFNDARGEVINDYQAELETKWLAELKKKYPVRINQQELNKL